MKRSLITIVTIFIVNSWLHAEQIDVKKIQAQFESRIKKYTLDNGMRVVLMKNGFTPTLACYLKVGVGSANEPFDQAGTAHFLEHLLFKGNEVIGTKDYEKERKYVEQIKATGEKIDAINRKLLDPLLNEKEKMRLSAEHKKLSQLLTHISKFHRKYILSEEDSKAYSLAGQVGYNAYTSADVTNYQIKLPKNRLELWAYLESNRFIKPVFREFYAERKVILEERRMRYDSRPGSLLYETYVKTAFGISPYGKPVIGFKSNILKMKMSETYDFFYRNYIPSRMVITIVGDLEFEPTYQLVKKYFSRIPARPEPEFPPIEYEGPRGRVVAELEKDHTPTLITGWHKPSIYHEDDLVFEVISKLLTDGQTSRLQQRLVLEEKLASYIYSYNGNPGEKLANTFSIHLGAYDEKSYDKIIEIIDSELQKLAEEGPTVNELEKVKNRFNASLVKSLRSNAGLADSLSYYELLLGDYKQFFKYLNRVQKITPDEVKRVAGRYFIRKNNVTAYIKKPRNPAPAE